MNSLCRKRNDRKRYDFKREAFGERAGYDAWRLRQGLSGYFSSRPVLTPFGRSPAARFRPLNVGFLENSTDSSWRKSGCRNSTEAVPAAFDKRSGLEVRDSTKAVNSLQSAA